MVLWGMKSHCLMFLWNGKSYHNFVTLKSPLHCITVKQQKLLVTGHRNDVAHRSHLGWSSSRLNLSARHLFHPVVFKILAEKAFHHFVGWVPPWGETIAKWQHYFMLLHSSRGFAKTLVEFWWKNSISLRPSPSIRHMLCFTIL